MERSHETLSYANLVTRTPQTPAEALEALGLILRRQPVLIDPLFVTEDLAGLRQAFPSDSEFTRALLAVGGAIVQACARKASFGVPLTYQLKTWYRASFPSQPGMKRKAELRLIFRPNENGHIEVLAFGHRRHPQAVYFTAKVRTES